MTRPAEPKAYAGKSILQQPDYLLISTRVQILLLLTRLISVQSSLRHFHFIADQHFLSASSSKLRKPAQPSCRAVTTISPDATVSKQLLDDAAVTIRPPWLAEGQGKAKRLFAVEQGPSKRVIGLARDQTIKQLTSAEFKDRLADVLCLLPELRLSTMPPKMLSMLVMMSPSAIAEQLVLLRGLIYNKQYKKDLLMNQPTLLVTPYADTALQFERLKTLLESPRRRGGQHPYSQVDFDDFVATHPEFMVPENVVLAMKSLRLYLGKSLGEGESVQDFIVGNPQLLVKGYRDSMYAAVQRMSAQDTSFREWWL